MGTGLITGIDIGNHAVKVVTLRRRGTAFEAVGAGMAHVPGDIAEAPAPAVVLGGVVKRLLRTQRIPTGRIVVGLGGRGTMVRCLNEPICPRWKLELLMGYEVEEGVGGGGGVAYDFRPLDLPEFEEGQFTVLLAQAQAEVVAERLAAGRTAAGRADEVDMNCFGVGNVFAVSPQCDEEAVSLVLDIGAEETSVALLHGSAFYYARTIGGGGKRFTARIQKDLELSFEAAEQLKIDQAAVRAEPKGLEAVNATDEALAAACRAEAQALAGAVQGSLVFFRSQLAKSAGGNARNPKLEALAPERLYVTGGGARLPGLTEFLGERLRLPAEALRAEDVFARLRGSAELAFDGPQAAHFATAAGLALGRASVEGFALNLLPEEEKQRRRFWDRTVYAVAAAAAAILLFVLAVFDGREDLAVTRVNSERWEEKVTAARDAYKELRSSQSRNRRLEAMVNALDARRLAGPDLLRSLDVLRRHTPRDMFFTSIRAEELAALEGRTSGASAAASSGRGRGRGRGADRASASATEESAERRLVLEGFCLAPNEEAAIERVSTLVTDLPEESGGLFRAVEQKLGSFEPSPTHLASYFSGDGEVFTDPKPGSAYYFVLECTLP